MENVAEDHMSTKQNGKSESKKKYNFYKKPSIRKKVPEVKQTLTSYKRMLNANPLLKYEKEGKDLWPINKQLLGSSSNGIGIENDSKRLLEKQSLEPNFISEKSVTKNNQMSNSLRNSSKCTSQFPKKYSIISGNHKPQSIAKSGNINMSKPRAGFNTSSTRFLSSTPLENKKTSRILTKKDTKQGLKDIKKNCTNFNSVTHDNSVCNSVSNIHKQGKNKLIKRSLSAQHFERKKGLLNKIQPQACFSYNQRTQSLDVISSLKPNNIQPDISPIAEVSQESTIMFKTPTAYQRRSIATFTPKSAHSVRRSEYLPSTSLPTLNDLEKRLKVWLLKRGKSLSTFHHLKCFGVPENKQESFNEENKENLEVNEDLDKGSYEDLKIMVSENDNRNSNNNKLPTIRVLKEENAENVAKAALEDLHKLIMEGYCRLQCEGWLELIRQRYQKLENEPEYWECRAALEQSRGNISNAVHCYKTAIVHGAEIQSVDESLDVLLQKFSLLNITADSMKSDKSLKERARIVQDARNVFKSSIIQFAVQERKLKKTSKDEDKKQLIVTPVRRSTRLSRSAYSSTPGIKICSSLHELNTSDREAMDFKKNKAIF